MLKILELFCGAGGWSRGFKDIFPNAEFTGVDINNFRKNYPFNFIQADLLDWKPTENYDIVLASPPCSEFSEIKRHTAQPYDERIGLDLVWRSFYLINSIKPHFWVLENVWGLSEFIGPPKDIVRYRKAKNGKRAYLWGCFPDLGFFDEDINYKPQAWHFKNGYGPKASMLHGLIPLALSRQMAKQMKGNNWIRNKLN